MFLGPPVRNRGCENPGPFHSPARDAAISRASLARTLRLTSHLTWRFPPPPRPAHPSQVQAEKPRAAERIRVEAPIVTSAYQDQKELFLGLVTSQFRGTLPPACRIRNITTQRIMT
jgi:hypothetical protein